MNITLVVNPNSGRGRAATVGHSVQSALQHAGHRVNVELAARDLEIDPDEQLIVIVGGDGTVHHVAPLAIRLGVPVYQIPMGTENLFARQFGMTRVPQRLVDAVARWNVNFIDVARITRSPRQTAAAEASVPEPPPGEACFLMLSVGPDASVVHRLAAVRRGAIGHWSYIRPILHEAFHPALHPLTVEADGVPLITDQPGLLIVANSREYGVRIDPALNASITDGLLDIVFFPARSSLRLVSWALRSRARAHLRARGLIYATARRVRISCRSHEMPVQVDGEPAGTVADNHRSLQVEADPGTLQVLTA